MLFYRVLILRLILWAQRIEDKIYRLFAINITMTIGKSVNVFAIGDQNQPFWLFRQSI